MESWPSKLAHMMAGDFAGGLAEELLPELLYRYRAVRLLFYGSCAALCLAVPVVQLYGAITHPSPGLPWLLKYGASVFFGAIGVSALFAMFRDEGIASSSQGSSNLPIASKTDSDFVVCPRCGFEQWRGYKACEKCGIPFSSGRR